MGQFLTGGIQLELQISGRGGVGSYRRPAPAPADAKGFLQASGNWALIPSSWAMTPANLPLDSQFWMASRWNVSSNWARAIPEFSLMVFSLLYNPILCPPFRGNRNMLP